VDHIIRVFLTKAKEKIDFGSFVKNIADYERLDEESIFHLGELATIPERAMLRNRMIPYRLVDEKRFPASDLPFLGEDDLSRFLSEKLKGEVPDEAYFVDTPNLPLCPTIGKEEICMIDTTISPPVVSHEPILETSWGEVPHSIWTVRLFLDTKYAKSEGKIRKAFCAVVKGESKLQTHY
jgi:hypothetical protein